jgi:hypothetical protein
VKGESSQKGDKFVLISVVLGNAESRIFNSNEHNNISSQLNQVMWKTFSLLFLQRNTAKEQKIHKELCEFPFFICFTFNVFFSLGTFSASLVCQRM